MERSGAGKETVLPPDLEPHIGAESKYEKIKTASNYEIDTPAIVDGSEEAGVDGIVLFYLLLFLFFFSGDFSRLFSFLLFSSRSINAPTENSAVYRKNDQIRRGLEKRTRAFAQGLCSDSHRCWLRMFTNGFVVFYRNLLISEVYIECAIFQRC